MTNGCMVLMNSVFDPTSKPWFSLLRTSGQGSSEGQNLIPPPCDHTGRSGWPVSWQFLGLLEFWYSSLLFRPFSFLCCVAEYILEPPPCRTEPGNCTQFCTMQEDCPEGLQCCSAFCGIICTLNKYIMRKR